MARQVHGGKGQTLLEAMRADFQNAEAPCGGSGRCGRCRVLVPAESAPNKLTRPLLSKATDEEASLLGPDNLHSGWRLACLARFARAGTVQIDQEERGFFLPEKAGTTKAVRVPGSAYCAAVDIGTTTISCVLADSSSGRIAARAAAANRQRSYGPDVVSRIENALRAPENLAKMQRLVRGQVGEMLGGLCRTAGRVRPERIHICGNTTMLHFWEGANVTGLGRMPFQPVFLETRESSIEMDDGRIVPCRLLPGISAFIGADIAAGIVACGLQAISGRPELLVDIGTNGEIVLACGDQLLATATAAGPAFEGAAISCGIPAVEGAVDHVFWQAGRFSFTTLGDAPPAGICGSGLLDLLACLRRAGLMDENGRLKSPADSAGEPAFRFPSAPGLTLTQADIRQLQLAKGAVAAGIRVLSRRAGLALANIGRVHLAGGFGSSLDPGSALDIGLMPAELAGRIEAAGNTALAGTLMSARDPSLLDLCARVASRVRVVDLSRDAGFKDAFMEAMRFPALTK